MAKTTMELSYKVVDARDVMLTISFGHGQLGASVVTGANAAIGLITNWKVGDGKALRGQALDIHSVVTDVNAQTNNVNAVYDLTGGDHPQALELESTVPNNGDSERFHLVINFV